MKKQQLEKYHQRKRGYEIMQQTTCKRQTITYCKDYKTKDCPLTCSYAKSKLEEELGEWSLK